MFHIKSTTAITDKGVKDLLACGIEGGMSFWLAIEKVFRTHLDTKTPDLYDAIVDGQGVLIGLAEGEDVNGKTQWVLNREAVARGLQALATDRPEVFARIALEDYDANDADLFLQVALFGEVVFG